MRTQSVTEEQSLLQHLFSFFHALGIPYVKDKDVCKKWEFSFPELAGFCRTYKNTLDMHCKKLHIRNYGV